MAELAHPAARHAAPRWLPDGTPKGNIGWTTSTVQRRMRERHGEAGRQDALSGARAERPLRGDPALCGAVCSPPFGVDWEIGLRAQGTRDQEAGPGKRPLAPPLTTE
jgi:hypothetical protein